MCFSVVQCGAVWCSVVRYADLMLYGAVCSLVMLYLAVCSTVLRCVTMCYSVLQCVAVCYSVMRCGAVCCSVVAVLCRARVGNEG